MKEVRLNKRVSKKVKGIHERGREHNHWSCRQYYNKLRKKTVTLLYNPWREKSDGWRCLWRG